MSEPTSKPTGPAMICATNIVNPGRARIGSLGGGINLPRTIEIVTLLMIAAGALVGLALALLVPVDGADKFLYGAAFGGTTGWFFATFSPLKGESLMTWLGLKVKTVHRQRFVEGQAVVLAVGCAPVDRYPVGKIRLMRGAVHIPTGSYDERGVPRTVPNKNVPEDAIVVAGAWMHRDAAGRVRELQHGTPLPPEIDGTGPRRSRKRHPDPRSASTRTPAISAAAPARHLED